MDESIEIGSIVQVPFCGKKYTGRVIKFATSGNARVRYFNSELQNMRIGEFGIGELFLSDFVQVDIFLRTAREHNLKLNLDLSSTKRREANSRRFD